MELLEPTVSGYDTVRIVIKRKSKKRYDFKFSISIEGEKVKETFPNIKKDEIYDSFLRVCDSTEFFA